VRANMTHGASIWRDCRLAVSSCAFAGSGVVPMNEKPLSAAWKQGRKPQGQYIEIGTEPIVSFISA
jgi:hypothetical protein